MAGRGRRSQQRTDKQEKPKGPEEELALMAGKKLQHFLAVPGLPTITSKVAQKIWELEFVEMEEFLPSNKTVQALKHQPTTQSLRDGVLGALQQFQQQQGRRVTDIMTWTRCFSTLYCGDGTKECRNCASNDSTYTCRTKTIAECWGHDVAVL